jgi:hypothetical protein
MNLATAAQLIAQASSFFIPYFFAKSAETSESSSHQGCLYGLLFF